MPAKTLRTIERKVEITPRTIEMRIRSGSFDEKDGSYALIVTTGERALREDHEIWDGPFYEELGLDDGEVMLERINSGRMNVLDNHGIQRPEDEWSSSKYSREKIMGRVLENSAGFEVVDGKRALVCRFRPSQRDELKGFRTDVADGTISQTSAGYQVFRYAVIEMEDGQVPVLRAIKWGVYEVSLTAVPQEHGTYVRSKDGKNQPTKNTCVVVMTGAKSEGPNKMAKRTQRPAPKQQIVPAQGGAPGRRSQEPEPAPEEVDDEPEDDEEPEETDADDAEGDDSDSDDSDDAGDDGEIDASVSSGAGRSRSSVAHPNAAMLERRRVLTIQGLAKKAGFPDKRTRSLIEKGIPLDTAREKILNHWSSDMGESEEMPELDAALPTAKTRTKDVSNEREAMVTALMARGVPLLMPIDKVSDHARSFLHYSLLDFAAHHLERRHEKTRGIKKPELVKRALATTDFPELLANTANRVLRDQYAIMANTWKLFCRQGTLPDFKLSSRPQLGDAPALEEIPENGAVTVGKIGEAAEKLKLKSYGKLVAITRQAIINDDLNAFTRIPSQFAISAAVLIEDEVYKIFGLNAAMSDTVALFHATHGNALTGAGSALAVAGLSGARAALRAQKTINGKYLNLPIKTLLVPVALETTADQLNTQLMAATTSTVNPFSGKYAVVTNPRLDAQTNGTTTWYAICDPMFCDTIEVAFLEGESGPTIESEQGFEIAGVKIKCSIDVGVKAIDWRGMVRNAGV